MCLNFSFRLGSEPEIYTHPTMKMKTCSADQGLHLENCFPCPVPHTCSKQELIQPRTQPWPLVNMGEKGRFLDGGDSGSGGTLDRPLDLPE